MGGGVRRRGVRSGGDAAAGPWWLWGAEAEADPLKVLGRFGDADVAIAAADRLYQAGYDRAVVRDDEGGECYRVEGGP